MSYLIRESISSDKDLINNFNKKLENYGITFRLPIPADKKVNIEDLIFENKFILTENEQIVVAGYTLKCQLFQLKNDLSKIGYYYNPVTAGLFNKKYNICGIMLLKDAHKKYPNLFCLGMGGYSEALPRLLSSLNWRLQTIPFFFKIYKPYSFLQNMRYLKKTKITSLLISLIKNIGIGWIFIKLFFIFISLFHIQFSKTSKLAVKEIEVFDENFDSIWEEAKENYSFVAVRNRLYLKKLYSSKRFIKLVFLEENKIVGWSIALCTNLKNHKQFGNMNLGSIIDCFSLKGYETNIIKKTSDIIKKKGADLVISNQSHVSWQNAFKRNSYINGPSNFIFASSKQLSEKLTSAEKLIDFIHLTRGDGDGPINL